MKKPLWMHLIAASTAALLGLAFVNAHAAADVPHTLVIVYPEGEHITVEMVIDNYPSMASCLIHGTAWLEDRITWVNRVGAKMECREMP